MQEHFFVMTRLIAVVVICIQIVGFWTYFLPRVKGKLQPLTKAPKKVGKIRNPILWEIWTPLGEPKCGFRGEWGMIADRYSTSKDMGFEWFWLWFQAICIFWGKNKPYYKFLFVTTPILDLNAQNRHLHIHLAPSARPLGCHSCWPLLWQLYWRSTPRPLTTCPCLSFSVHFSKL